MPDWFPTFLWVSLATLIALFAALFFFSVAFIVLCHIIERD